ncbi:MAG: hypothetical protein AB7G28_03715 [Pirellulales bacterium]
MNGIGPVELLMVLAIGLFTFGIPVATLVLVILIFRNTRNKK